MEEKFMSMPEGQHCLEAVKFLQDKGYRVIYCALYGAQNYNLQRDKSDYDYKAVVVPTLRDIVYNKKPVSEVVDLPFDGQVDVKDVRLMIDQWKKGATNFMELLYTDWFWVNPDYSPMFWFRLNRDKIAHANEESAIKAMVGMIKEKFNALNHPYPVQVEEVNEFGYASKQLSHEMRLLAMISQYNKKSYAVVLNPFREGGEESVRDYWKEILGVKTREVSYEADYAMKLGKRIVLEADKWFEQYKDFGFKFDEAVMQDMDEQKFLIIKRALEAEMWEDKV